MNEREQRGLIIAAVCRLNKTRDCWLVPSQSTASMTYRVDPNAQTCTCPDHQESGHKCKHLFAVEFTVKRETDSDGNIIDTRSITFTEKVSYKQNWPAYNRAQSMEKDRIQELLIDLCSGVEEPERSGAGRKPHSVRDSIFAMVMKVYGTLSSRRSSCDLRDAYAKGHLSRLIPGVKVCSFFENPAFTPILKSLIARSAAPLRTVESKFAIDSSGFSTCKFVRWYDHKYGVTRQRHDWIKVHIACGTKTNVVTAVRIFDKETGDAPQFVPLLKETAKKFTIAEVSADKAYVSVENFEAVAECGGTAFIAFKTNSTGSAGGLFEKMFHYFKFKNEEYMAHYHQRSNVESAFSMVKRKFGDSIRSKNEVAMVNEVLAKFVCHNLCVLIQEQCELGIEAEFWKDEKAAGTVEATCYDLGLDEMEFIG